MKLKIKQGNNIKKIIYILLWLFIGKIYSIEKNFDSSNPKFAIYLGKVPVYANLSGNFTFFPEKENQKVETLLKNVKRTQKTALDASYLTIKFENKVYRFHELTEINSEWDFEEGAIRISGTIPTANVKIFTILKNDSKRRNAFIISYGAINNSNRIVDIGFRSLIDVGSENQDGVPLKICTDNTNEKEIYPIEYKFTPFKSGYWETYESEFETNIGIRNHLIDNKNIPPNQVAFVNWEKAFLSEWKYFTNKNVSIDSDSAVLLWWYPQPVKIGEKFQVTTEFELKKKKESVSFEVIDPEKGTGRLHIFADNNSLSPKEISYSIDFGEYPLTSMYDNPMKFLLNPNSILDKIIPITLHGKGDNILKITEKNGTQIFTHNLPIRLAIENQSQSPKFWKSSKYPIIYNSEFDGLKLKGVIRAKDSGKKLGETDLISVKSIQNTFVYLGEVDLQEFNGEVLVEIFKQ